MQRIRWQDLVTGRQPQSGSAGQAGHLPRIQVDADSVSTKPNKQGGGAEVGREAPEVLLGNAAPCRLERTNLADSGHRVQGEPPAGRVQDETQISIYKKQREDLS